MGDRLGFELENDMPSEKEHLVLVSGGHYMTESDVPGFTIYQGEPPTTLVERTAARNKLPLHNGLGVIGQFDSSRLPENEKPCGI